MKEYYEITYETVGTRKIDTMLMWSDSFTNAIKEFCEMEIEVNGFKFHYNESAIKSIVK